METSQTVLGGLPYDLISVSYFRLVGYILLLLLGDCAGGIPASRLILKPQAFLLIRAGWKRWFGLTLRRCFCAVFAACMLLLAVGLFSAPEWKTLFSWLLFTLHMEMIAAVQVLLIALFENAAAAILPVVLMQIVTLFLSKYTSGAWALLLPGNWGALARTAKFEVPDNYGRLHGGIPLWAAIALNAAVLLAICLFGWRLIRRKCMKQ